MVRKPGTGYRSQAAILLVIQRDGKLYGQQIVEATGLGREEMWRNLAELTRREILKRERQGVKVYYSAAVSEAILDCIISILARGGPRRFLSQARKTAKVMKRGAKSLFSTAEKTTKVEKEIVELEASGEELYGKQGIKKARSWRTTKNLLKEVKLKPSFIIPESRLEQRKRELTPPRKPKLHDITLPSGLKVTVRELKLLEAIDLAKIEATLDDEVNNWLVALKKLLS